MKDIILALVTRTLFAAHGLIGIWRAQTEWDRVEYWLLLVPIALLVVEALFTVGIRGGEEYKWISPCVLLYLSGIVPSIWFLELKNFELRQEVHYCSDQYWGQVNTPGCGTTFRSIEYRDEDVMELLANSTRLRIACQLELELGNISLQEDTTAAMTSTAGLLEQTTVAGLSGGAGDVVNEIENVKKVLDNLLGNVNIFNRTTWVLVLHQLLLFILIIGRWLLPTGEGISKDELSQLLLVFIGVGADILEFVTETVKELSVRCDRVLIICIMGFWSWSTLQFTLVLTAAKARRTRAAGIYDEEASSRVQSPVVVDDDGEKEKEGKCHAFWTNMEVWGIMSTLILQDGPFLAMRLYIMIGRNVLHQMIVFFTCKNCLVVILQLYRLVVIATAKKEEEEEEVTVAAKKLETVKTLALAKNKFARALKKTSGATSSGIGGNKEKRSPKIAPEPSNGSKLPEI